MDTAADRPRGRRRTELARLLGPRAVTVTRKDTAITAHRSRSATNSPAASKPAPPGTAPPRATIDLALLAVAIVWGSSYLAAKEVVAPDGVFAFLVIRLALAGAGMALIAAPRLRGVNRTEIGLGMLFGTILSAVFTLETFGVAMTSASNAGLIISLTIVMTPILEGFVQHTYLPPTFYGAVVLAVAGVGLLTQPHGFTPPSRGDLLIAGAAAARAVHITVIARLSEGRTIDSARVTLVQFCTGVVVFSILASMHGRGVGEVAALMTTQSWLLTIYLALVCTVFAFVVQIWAVRSSSPARVSLVLGTEPLWAAGFGVLLAHDRLAAAGLCGALLILLGTNWGRIIESRRRRIDWCQAAA